MSGYQEQANKFLEDTGTKMTCIYQGERKHFADDKHERSVYAVTFTRRSECGKKAFTVDFGQSLRHTGVEPTSYDVLACLQKNDPGSFEEFCSDSGYDSDSRKAHKMWCGCGREWRKVYFVFGDVLDQLAEIQ